MKSCSTRNFSRLFLIMMGQVQTNEKECYQGTAILQLKQLNGEGRAHYVCVSMRNNTRYDKYKNKTNIFLHFQEIKSY